MHEQIDLFAYKFRLLVAGLVVVAFLLLISALVTAIGSGSILATKNTLVGSTSNESVSSGPNAVTDGISSLVTGTKNAALATGRALYGACRSITAATTQTSKVIRHSSAVAVQSMWHGTTYAAHGVVSGYAFVFHIQAKGIVLAVQLPGKIAGSITSGHAVTAIIQPDSSKPLPIISDKTSALAIANFNEQQRQQIEQLQAAQLVANQNLGGLVVAGDPTHGGYPAKWDNARQDSMVDSWGMYSRECVSYAAWKVYQTYGTMPYWGGVGNANQWVRDAKNAGIPTSSAPQIHSVAISMNGYYGHAMWVEKVSGDMIYVSQYNYDLHGHYSEMWVKSSSLTYIYFH